MKRPGRRALAVLALLAPVVVLVGLHLLEARRLVGFLSGSFVGSDLDTFFGLAYVLAWFTSVLVVPVVTIAAVLCGVHGMLVAGMRTWRSSRAR